MNEADVNELQGLSPEESRIFRDFANAARFSPAVTSLPARMQAEAAEDRALSRLRVWRKGRKFTATAITAVRHDWTTHNNEAGRERHVLDESAQHGSADYRPYCSAA
jgi:hypothetical protein